MKDELHEQYVRLVSTMTSRQMLVYVHARLPDKEMRGLFQETADAIKGADALPRLIQLCAKVLVAVHKPLKEEPKPAITVPALQSVAEAEFKAGLPGPSWGKPGKQMPPKSNDPVLLADIVQEVLGEASAMVFNELPPRNGVTLENYANAVTTSPGRYLMRMGPLGELEFATPGEESGTHLISKKHNVPIAKIARK